MSVPGIGVVTVLACVSTVEDPARFVRSRSVGAHMGLTPRQYQSGEVDRSGRISRCGNTLARTLMYEAAVVILSRVKKASGLKDWAQAIAKRSGIGKARVAHIRAIALARVKVAHRGEGADNCEGGRWAARTPWSPLWTVQCLCFGPDVAAGLYRPRREP